MRSSELSWRQAAILFFCAWVITFIPRKTASNPEDKNPNKRTKNNGPEPPILCRVEVRTLTIIASGIPYWPSKDPIGKKGGANLYSFVGNDGINRWDLLGEKPEPEKHLPPGIVLPEKIPFDPNDFKGDIPLPFAARPPFPGGGRFPPEDFPLEDFLVTPPLGIALHFEYYVWVCVVEVVGMKEECGESAKGVGVGRTLAIAGMNASEQVVVNYIEKCCARKIKVRHDPALVDPFAFAEWEEACIIAIAPPMN